MKDIKLFTRISFILW